MKLGLVLEGGANRGNFSNGVMDVLMQQNIWADYVIGASAGIANGVSYVSRQIGRSLSIGVDFMPTPAYSGLKHLLNPRNRSLYNIRYVFDEIPNGLLPFDYETFARFPGSVVAVVTNLNTGRAEYLEVPRNDRQWRTLVASCALPFLFQPVRIGQGLYMDGGITDPIPARHALEDGCDRVIVVTTREREYVKGEEKTLRLAAKRYGRYPEFARALNRRTESYNACRKELFELERQGKAFIIEPVDTKGFSRTEKDREKIRALYQQGVDVAEGRMDALREWLSDSEKSK